MSGHGDYHAEGGDKLNHQPTLSYQGEYLGEPAENEVTTSSLTYSHKEWFGAHLDWQVFIQDFSALYGGGTFATYQDPAYGEEVFDQSRNDSRKYGSRITVDWQNLGDSPLSLTTGLDYLSDSTYQELALTGRKWVPE